MRARRLSQPPCEARPTRRRAGLGAHVVSLGLVARGASVGLVALGLCGCPPARSPESASASALRETNHDASPPSPRAPSPASPPLPVAPTIAPDEEHLKGATFDVVWRAKDATRAEAEAVLARGEAARTKFVALLGAHRVGDGRFFVRLAGEGDREHVPSVDPKSRAILLYRFPGGASGAYEAPLAHEMVHAIRFLTWTRPENQTDPMLFWEEGLAELLARHIGFPSAGFPLYGTDPYTATASFYPHHEELGIDRLVTEHRKLNFRCMAQAYVERLSFMTYLEQRSGIRHLVELSFNGKAYDVAGLEKALDGTIAGLTREHDAKILVALSSREVQLEAERFRAQTPIRYFPLCPSQRDR